MTDHLRKIWRVRYGPSHLVRLYWYIIGIVVACAFLALAEESVWEWRYQSIMVSSPFCLIATGSQRKWISLIIIEFC